MVGGIYIVKKEKNLRNHLFKEGSQGRGGCQSLGKSKKELRGTKGDVQGKAFQKGRVSAVSGILGTSSWIKN